MLARTYGLPSRAALYRFLPDPRDLAEHEEEYQLYRWGPEHDKYLAAQIVEAVLQAAGMPSRTLESRLLKFGSTDQDDKKTRLKASQAAVQRAAGSGSGWLTVSAPSKRM